MEFWNHKINVGKAAASMQVQIINTFSDEKRMKIALDFANMGVQQTRHWIKETNPQMSELEVQLEFVRLMYFNSQQMSEKQWLFYKKEMTKKINKDWANRFRKMMKSKELSYEEVAQMGGFKNANVVKATISRGLPNFAKFAVLLFEKN